MSVFVCCVCLYIALCNYENWWFALLLFSPYNIWRISVHQYLEIIDFLYFPGSVMASWPKIYWKGWFKCYIVLFRMYPEKDGLSVTLSRAEKTIWYSVTWGKDIYCTPSTTERCLDVDLSVSHIRNGLEIHYFLVLVLNKVIYVEKYVSLTWKMIFFVNWMTLHWAFVLFIGWDEKVGIQRYACITWCIIITPKYWFYWSKGCSRKGMY